MCGIAGLLSKNGQYPPPGGVINVMSAAMHHRGPDAEGFFSEELVALAHRRLSIIDLSSSANQPFFSASGRFVLVFNGELYNFQEVRRELTHHTFKTTGDTEVLVEAIDAWGVEEAVQKLKGMFAFAVYDRASGDCWLVRDRLGVKPLYYFENEHHILFASEIRSLLASGLIPKKINKNALFTYLHTQSVHGTQSIINNIKELKAGGMMKISGGKKTITTYWKTTDSFQQNGLVRESPDQIKRTIRDLLTKAVAQRLMSDVPVGAFLSGGIDSSIVVGLMAEVSASIPQTFNISFSEEAYDESAYAEIIAKKFKTNHHPLLLRPEAMLDNLMPALQSLDTPSGDGINSYVVSKAIREAGITVALSGVGGDELFAGYPFFLRHHRIRSWKNWWSIASPLRMLGAAIAPYLPGQGERVKMILQAKTTEIQDLYSSYRTILTPEFIQAATGSYFEGVASPNALLLETLQTDSALIAQMPNLSEVSVAEYAGYTQYTLLKDMDQMSMAVSLEVREPFFDHELIEYVLRIPDGVKFPHYPKKLLVEAVGDLLPQEIVHRKKQGFEFPWKLWMKQELKSFCSEKLDHLGQRGIFDELKLNQRWQKFLKGDPSIRWMELWILVVLEHWLEKNGVE